MKSRILIISVCICFLLVNVKCAKEKVPPPPPPDPVDALEDISEKLIARIFVDATVSMEGFVVPGSSTNYAQIFQYLESAVVGGWRDEEVKFYKFGTEALPIQRSQYLRAAQRGFYHDPQVNKETYIQKVIEYDSETDGSAGELTVILTDLFQDESDVTLLVAKLKDEYIQKALAVGVLGLRGQFDGMVYDVGIDASYFPYCSSEDPESFRPFYLLMLGKHADIARYFEQLKASGLSFISEDNFIIFSRHLVDHLSSFEDGSMESIDNLVEFSKLVPSGFRDKRFKQFRVRGDSENAEFEATLKYNPLPYAMLFESKGLKPEIIAEQLQGNKFVDSTEAARSFSIEDIRILGSGSDVKISFSAKLTPSSLSYGGIYRYEVILRPEASAYRTPTWCMEWDMGATLDGCKTLNLNRFLSDLQRATVQIHRPKVAKFYCYIQR